MLRVSLCLPGGLLYEVLSIMWHLFVGDLVYLYKFLEDVFSV